MANYIKYILLLTYIHGFAPPKDKFKPSRIWIFLIVIILNSDLKGLSWIGYKRKPKKNKSHKKAFSNCFILISFFFFFFFVYTRLLLISQNQGIWIMPNFISFSSLIRFFYQRKILNIQKSTKYNVIRFSNYSKKKKLKIKT